MRKKTLKKKTHKFNAPNPPLRLWKKNLTREGVKGLRRRSSRRTRKQHRLTQDADAQGEKEEGRDGRTKDVPMLERSRVTQNIQQVARHRGGRAGKEEKRVVVYSEGTWADTQRSGEDEKGVVLCPDLLTRFSVSNCCESDERGIGQEGSSQCSPCRLAGRPASTSHPRTCICTASRPRPQSQS